MKLVPLHVPDELFALAESSSFQGTYEMPDLELRAGTFHFEGPLTYDLTISNTGGAFYVSGLVTGRAITPCVRCLDDAVYDLEGDVEAYFLIANSEVELTDDEETEYEVLPEDHIIDLEPLLRAALVLELPAMPLCHDECKGLCAQCGANLNREACTCAVDVVDDTHPFAALKNISFD